MSITLAELCEIPHLGLTAVGGAGQLRRKVQWTHVSEMEDPTPWLEGGELLMSVGLRFPASGAAQVRYVERLHRRDVAGFAIADVMRPKLTRQLLDAVDALALPLLVVAQEVSFIEVVRTVALANEGTAQRRLLTHVHIFDSLQGRIAGDCSAADLLDRVGRLLGYELYAAGTDGRPLLAGVPTPPAELAAALPARVERARSIGDAHVLPVVVGGAIAGHLVAVERQEVRSAGLVAVQHACTIAALELERLLHAARVADRYRGRLLEQLIEGELAPSGVRRELRAEGLDPDGEAVLAAVATDDGGELDADERAGLADALARAGIPHLLAALDACYLLAEDDGALAALRARPRLRAGVSRPFRPADGVGLARREALLAAQVATSTGQSLVRSGRDVQHASAMPPDRASLERLVQTTLGPLLDYDALHNTELVASLRRYLERDRSLSAAAAELFVHPNSLAYRLRRIEEIAGRRLASVPAQTDFWLALEAQRILNLTSERGRRVRG